MLFPFNALKHNITDAHTTTWQLELLLQPKITCQIWSKVFLGTRRHFSALDLNHSDLFRRGVHRVHYQRISSAMQILSPKASMNNDTHGLCASDTSPMTISQFTTSVTFQHCKQNRFCVLFEFVRLRYLNNSQHNSTFFNLWKYRMKCFWFI